MKTTRLLFPFTHGVEMQALEVALRFAHNHDAILVSLVVLQVSEETRVPRIRPEMLQQACDFLEAVRNKASKHGVEVERFEVTASNIVEKIAVFAEMKKCEGILLFARDGKGLLMQTYEIQEMIGQVGMPLRYLIHLPIKSRPPYRRRTIQRLFSWLNWKQPISDGALEHQEAVQPGLKLEQVNDYTEHTCIF